MSQPVAADTLQALQTEASAHPDSPDAAYALANAYADQERWPEAKSAFNTVLDLAPADAAAYNGLGTVYENLGDMSEAEAYYRKAIASKPSLSSAYFNLGNILADQHRYVEALPLYVTCLRYSTDPEELEAAKQVLAPWYARRYDVTQMYQRVRSWSFTSLLIGGLSIVANGVFDATWGIMMLVIALLAWRIRLPAMFLMFAVIMAWAGVTNILGSLSGSGGVWAVGALLQLYWSFSLVREFRRYGNLPMPELYAAGAWPAGLKPPQDEGLITGRFALAGGIIAALALLSVPVVFVGTIIIEARIGTSQSLLLGRLFSAISDISVLALALSIAGLFSHNKYRTWSIVGIVFSALVIAGWLVLVLL